MLTLGPCVVMWLEEYLRVPAGRHRGKRLRLTGDQLDVLNEIYRFDEDGRRRWSHMSLFGPKGSSKSPLAAMVSIVEFVGPCRPYDIDDYGFLVGEANPEAWIAIGANSEDQAARTTWKPLRAMLSSDCPLVDEFDIDVGKTRIELRDGQTIEYFGASAGSIEGLNVSCFIAEETQHATATNGGVAMIETMQGNIDKTPNSFMFEVTNAPELGRGSFAEQTYMRALEQEELDEDQRDVCLFHRTGPKLDDIRSEDARGDVMDALRHVYGDAADPEHGWIDLEQIYKGLLRRPVHVARRFYLNEVVKSEARMIDAVRWAELADEGATIPDGTQVVLGFDGSESEDATALVAVSIAETPHVQTVGIWRRPEGVLRDDWRIPREEVYAAVDAARNRWECKMLVADPSISWKATIDEWGQNWGGFRALDVGDVWKQGGAFVTEIWWNNAPRLTTAVVAQALQLLDGEGITFTHDAHPTLTEHALNMMRKATSHRGSYETVTRAHTGESAQIDAGIAMMLALWGAVKLRHTFAPAGAGGQQIKGGANARARAAYKRLQGN